nr:MAG TPA: hypothetical protein [Caudoviricetes sp.]
MGFCLSFPHHKYTIYFPFCKIYLIFFTKKLKIFDT